MATDICLVHHRLGECCVWRVRDLALVAMHTTEEELRTYAIRELLPRYCPSRYPDCEHRLVLVVLWDDNLLGR